MQQKRKLAEAEDFVYFPCMTKKDAGWRFDNTYARLPEEFFARQKPEPVRVPELVVLNATLAKKLGLDPDALSGAEGAALFAGNTIPPGAEPIAQAYAGHQFGHLNMLGDGRAVLLGEHLDPAGKRFDVQLKGSGQTPFSRRGDGRAALGPMLREYIVSEAMHGLGIPTTRSLAVVSTGEPVFRELPLPGAILTRVASSHIRVGTFQYAAGVKGDGSAVRALADYTIQRHYPEIAARPDRYGAFLEAVVENQASLIARWMLVGFIHGVMNTDNMTLSGESIDYGPCAFMDRYSPATVFSSIDRNGRYAYANQPRIGAWNLARLAETLLPLLAPEKEAAFAQAQTIVEGFPDRYRRHWLKGMRCKLGLFTEELADDALVTELLQWMDSAGADFTNTFRTMTLTGEMGFAPWKERWEARLSRQPQSREEVQTMMRAHNPLVIPRNHRVEEALAAAAQRADFSLMQRLVEALENPFRETPAQRGYEEAPPDSGTPYQTFCGT